MAPKEIVMCSLLVVLAIEIFVMCLEARRDRRASEKGADYLEALYVLAQAFSRPHQSMLVPAQPAPAADPRAVQDPRQRRVVEVTRDERPSSAPTIEVTREEPLPRETVPLSARRQQERLESPTLPSYQPLPALGEDEDDTRIITRVGPPPVRR